MNQRINRLAVAIAAIAAVFAVSSPAFAEGHGGGFGGGGHMGGGFNGGGQMHGGFNGGVHPGGYRAGGHFDGGHFRGVAPAIGPRYPANHFGGPAYIPHRMGPAYIPRGTAYGGHRRAWGGGYFHGGYWPRAYFHSGFIRYFPVLPAFYSTFWFGGVPYYYWDDAYYTWSSADSGYVATDPPPLTDSSASYTGSAYSAQGAGSSNIYAYPKNGQTDEQAATDRFQCHQWAVSQTGFDPSNGSGQPASANAPSDYRRAMIACLDARGYSAN